ncbi:hypothetical protein [Alienimonas californiensis]|uniref:Sigma-70, region 4 n=1 Tax=Alienimonas californiensis TaxID=2527989 RepID=A0A517P6W3_9PLAN|nr:hypothetical protein [Alienimonas californiensis]QDT15103.1 hypothetical protein CA12_11840 [Alienimonas californiensis]
MSVVTSRGTKTLLPRRDPEQFWNSVRAEYAAEDRRRWKSLAMLALTEAVGWPPDRVALAFGLTRRQVNRGVDSTRRSLQTRFRPDWDGDDESGGAKAEGGRNEHA